MVNDSLFSPAADRTLHDPGDVVLRESMDRNVEFEEVFLPDQSRQLCRIG